MEAQRTPVLFAVVLVALAVIVWLARDFRRGPSEVLRDAAEAERASAGSTDRRSASSATLGAGSARSASDSATSAPGDATASPGDARFASGGARIGTGDATIAPGNARFVSDASRSPTAEGARPAALASAPDGVLAGRVVDERGVARDLRLVLAPIGGSQAQRLAAQRRLSDLALDHGRFRFEGVPPGRYELTVFDELYGMSPVVIESDGRGLAGIALDVRPGVRVLVELGAQGVVRVQDGLGRSWHEREHDGTALFALLPGAYRLEARSNEGAERALDFVVRDKPVRIDLRP